MDRPAFERAMTLGDEERMPCMSPIRYPARKMSIKEGMMRKGIKADSRDPFASLFYDGTFGTPLTPEKAGLDLTFHIGDPGIVTENSVEYIASYLLPR